MTSQHISLSIGRGHEFVYRFLSNPAYLVQWAPISGTCRAVGPHRWRIGMDDRRSVDLAFAPDNVPARLNASVIYPDGSQRRIEVRLAPEGEGTRLDMTLSPRPAEDAEALASEAEWMRADLLALKAMLEAHEEVL